MSVNADDQITLHTDGGRVSILQRSTFDCGPRGTPLGTPPERREWGIQYDVRFFPFVTLLEPFPTTHHVMVHSRSHQSRRRNPIPVRIVPVTLRVSPLLVFGHER